MKLLNCRLLLILFLIHTPAAYSSESGFDEVCSIYTEILNSSMTYEEANNYVHNNVSKRVTNKDAVELHSIMPNANPGDRYNIFKETVEEITKKKWDCPAMKVLMGKTADNW